MSDIKPHTLFDSSNGQDTAFTADTAWTSGWIQVVPYRYVNASIIHDLTGTLTTTTFKLYESGSNAAGNAGIENTDFATTPTVADSEIIWKIYTTAPYIKIDYDPGAVSAGTGTVLVTRG